MFQTKHLYEDNLISTLYRIKRKKGVITGDDIKKVSKKHKIPSAKVYQVASFYDFPQNKKIKYEVLNAGPLITRRSKNLKDYGRYHALEKAIERGQDFVIKEVEQANLRGRGGAGFPAAKKWKSCRNASGLEKYLIANGHNGDPSSNSDRYLMANHCHQLIEGMVIAAYAIGASKGIIYVEGEFQDSIKNLGKAIKKAYKNNLLGKNILGSGFSFDLRIFEAAGVYVCGESTALMRAIEGRVGEPRLKHIHTAEKGVFDKPTVLNNVETLINVPHIINIGSEEYAKTGTEKSKGTKVFSLLGSAIGVNIVEVPMGVALEEVIEKYVKKTKGKVKGVQFGGPLGGFLPKDLLKTPLCFDALSEAGSMMGDALIVIDDHNSIVDMTYFFTKFLEEQSCGKCISCKEGLRRINELFDGFKAGSAQEGDLDLVLELAENAKESSLCQLGRSIYNPVSTAIKYFKEDFKKER